MAVSLGHGKKRGYGARRKNAPMSEINVTPMVDVMLVLLIIFMITAPMMNTGVELTLPKVTAQQLEDPKGKLVLSITKTRKLLLGTSEVTWKELQKTLQPPPTCHADRQLRSRRRTEALTDANRAIVECD